MLPCLPRPLPAHPPAGAGADRGQGQRGAVPCPPESKPGPRQQRRGRVGSSGSGAHHPRQPEPPRALDLARAVPRHRVPGGAGRGRVRDGGRHGGPGGGGPLRGLGRRRGGSTAAPGARAGMQPPPPPPAPPRTRPHPPRSCIQAAPAPGFYILGMVPGPGTLCEEVRVPEDMVAPAPAHLSDAQVRGWVRPDPRVRACVLATFPCALAGGGRAAGGRRAGGGRAAGGRRAAGMAVCAAPLPVVPSGIKGCSGRGSRIQASGLAWLCVPVFCVVCVRACAGQRIAAGRAYGVPSHVYPGQSGPRTQGAGHWRWRRRCCVLPAVCGGGRCGAWC